MKKFIVIVILLTTFLYAPPYKETYSAEPTIPELINRFALEYGVDHNLALSVAKCESGLKPTTSGDGGKANGVFQYWKPTFERHSKEFGEELNYESPYDQIKLAMWAFSKGYAREWTTYRAIQNGGVYSFYSRSLGKHFTVRCKIE